MTTETQHAMVRRLAKRRFSGIPQPTRDIDSLYEAVVAIKENLELIIGDRGDPHVADTKAVTWADMLALGLIEEVQLPHSLSRT